MKIGVGITVHNRHEQATKSIGWWKLMMPEGSQLIIVDDGSDVPFPGADFRFEKPVGISAAKNKCLALLDKNDFIFCSDDDFHPKVSEWWEPYVNSNLNHLCYTFDRPVKYACKEYIAYDQPNGCFLFFKKICLEAVGGWDEAFKYWSYEHVDLSTRIHNAGLTPHAFMDVHNSWNLFFSADQHQTTLSSVRHDDKVKGIQHNRPLLEQNKFSKEFKPYK